MFARSAHRHPCAHPGRLLPVLALLTLCLAVLGLPCAAPARAAGHARATKVVRYDGARLTVPTGWPVFHLAQAPATCVRFNRHAVYLGTPGAEQACPVSEVGRTEAILVSPRRADSMPTHAVLDGASTAGAARGVGSVAQLTRADGRVRITATWNHHPALIRTALALSSLRAAARATNGHRPAAARQAHERAAAGDRAVSGAVSGSLTDATTVTGSAAPAATAAAATPGQAYTGLGFDACSTPSTTTMSDWDASPFRAVGVYIGGANMACTQSNLTAAWVSAESAGGWHLVPIYVGLQSPTSGCGCATISAASATAEGTAAAQDAVAQAAAIGLGAGNPIYFDMENYTRTASSTATVLEFLAAWTTQLHESGYLSGVYSSADSGITDLVDAATSVAGFVEPDDIWIADWNGQQTTADSHVPANEWADDQRLHQFEGGHTDDYGGASINIDGDYLTGATAAAGAGSASTVTPVTAGAPSITVAPQTDGQIDLTPAWAGQASLSSYEILGGTSPDDLTALETVKATRRTPVETRNVYPYFEVEGLDSSGDVLGTSTATETPERPAIYGHSAFVPASGPIGIPVACLNAPFCRVNVTIHDGTKVMAHASNLSVQASGGIAQVALSKHGHQLVADAKGGRLPVTIAVHSSNGVTVQQTMNLVPYRISGASPKKKAGASPSVTILGETDFVSRGWTGGVLAVCTAESPCDTTVKVMSDRGTVIADSNPQTLDVGQVGYLSFTLTAAGHALIHAAKGGQIGAKVQVVSTAGVQGTTTGAVAPATTPTHTATAYVALANYGNR